MPSSAPTSLIRIANPTNPEAPLQTVEKTPPITTIHESTCTHLHTMLKDEADTRVFSTAEQATHRRATIPASTQ